MNFSLIVCTYLRPQSLLRLLKSTEIQTCYPNEILIIDGSLNDETELVLKAHAFRNLKYIRVDKSDRGLTRQRNYGIKLTSDTSKVICFLDDDVVLEPNYFEELLATYTQYPKALAVGGFITNEVPWNKSDNQQRKSKFYMDGWMRDEPMRFKLRRFFGLLPGVPPGFMPPFSHGRSIGFLPPSGKAYEVEQLMGCAMSFKKFVFTDLSFSKYFEGYGLYEDADFSLRLAKQGKLYISTKARVEHHHDRSGRPNHFKYGKMVVRNGWYVWRVKYPTPSIKSRFKWNATVLLLTKLRLLNILTTSKRKEALTEGLGRAFGWFSLIFNKPKIT